MSTRLEWLGKYGCDNRIEMKIGIERWTIMYPSQLLPLIWGEDVYIPGYSVASHSIYDKTLHFANNVLTITMGPNSFTDMPYTAIVDKDILTQFIIEGIVIYEPMIKL